MYKVFSDVRKKVPIEGIAEVGMSAQNVVWNAATVTGGDRKSTL